MADVPEPTEYRVGEDSLEILALDDPACGFDEMVRLIAREVLAWRRGAAARTPDLEAARVALETLSQRMLRVDDPRRFGVNAAARVLEAVQRGSDGGDAIARILRVDRERTSGPDGEPPN